MIPPIVPLGIVMLGVAFADFRWRANRGQVITTRLVWLAVIAVAVEVVVSVLLGTVPALQTDWETHGPFDVLITILTVVEIIGWVYLPLIAGYFGMALWMRWRYGPDAAPDEN